MGRSGPRIPESVRIERDKLRKRKHKRSNVYLGSVFEDWCVLRSRLKLTNEKLASHLLQSHRDQCSCLDRPSKDTQLPQLRAFFGENNGPPTSSLSLATTTQNVDPLDIYQTLETRRSTDGCQNMLALPAKCHNCGVDAAMTTSNNLDRESTFHESLTIKEEGIKSEDSEDNIDAKSDDGDYNDTRAGDMDEVDNSSDENDSSRQSLYSNDSAEKKRKTKLQQSSNEHDTMTDAMNEVHDSSDQYDSTRQNYTETDDLTPTKFLDSDKAAEKKRKMNMQQLTNDLQEDMYEGCIREKKAVEPNKYKNKPELGSSIVVIDEEFSTNMPLTKQGSTVSILKPEFQNRNRSPIGKHPEASQSVVNITEQSFKDISKKKIIYIKETPTYDTSSNKHKLVVLSVTKLKVDQKTMHAGDNCDTIDIETEVNQPPPATEYVECEVCDFKAEYSVELNKHRFNKHGLISSAIQPCSFCGEVFLSWKGMKKHKEQEHNWRMEKDIACHICGLMVRRRAIQRHINMKHCEREQHVCPQCGKVFNTSSNMNAHLAMHDPNSVKTCPEEGCDRQFGAARLKRHIRQCHTKERNHICSDCGKGFFNVSALRVHERQHTGDEPYACQFCIYKAKQKICLKLHMKSNHPGEEVPK